MALIVSLMCLSFVFSLDIVAAVLLGPLVSFDNYLV